MLQDIVLKGSTDRSVKVRIIDETTGIPDSTIVYNTSGIALWYRREGAALTAITEATLAALTTAHVDGGFLLIADGEYRLDLPDAAFATGANYVDFGGTVTGKIVIGGRVRLVNVNVEDAVRAGLTALPNAAAEAAGGLYTRGTGAGQINQATNGQVDGNLVRIANAAVSTSTAQLGVNVVNAGGTAWATVLTNLVTSIWSATTRLLTGGTNIVLAKGTGITGFNDLSAAQVNAEADTALADYDGPTNAEMVARTLAAASYATATALQTVDDEVGAIDTVVDAILVDTAEIGAAGAGLTAVASAAALATVDSNVDAMLTRTIDAPIVTGAVATNVGNTASAFETNLTETAGDHHVGSYLLFTSGDLDQQQRRITAYNGTTKVVTTLPFTGVPGDADTFSIVNR